MSILLLVGLVLLVVNFAFLRHWSAIHTGTLNESGPYYGFWSGFGSDLGEATLVFALISTMLHTARVHNCEVKGCWRLGRHQTAANHKVCRTHHPEDSLTEKDVLDAHEAAK